MKKRFLCLVAVLAILLTLAVPGEAISVCAAGSYPSLSISGQTATCMLSVKTNSDTAKIKVTMKLYQGNTKIATWTASGTGKLSLKKTKTVASGKKFKLTADVTIDGKKQSTVSATGNS